MRLSSSEGAIRGAQEAGADAVPEVALYVKLANEERQRALDMIKGGDNHRASMLLARSSKPTRSWPSRSLYAGWLRKPMPRRLADAVDVLKTKAAQ